MSRTQLNIKDTESDLMIVYANISFAAACNYLSKRKNLGKYLGAEPFGAVTKLKFEHGAYYYNEERKLLLTYVR